MYTLKRVGFGSNKKTYIQNIVPKILVSPIYEYFPRIFFCQTIGPPNHLKLRHTIP